MISLSVGDIVKLLEQIPIWKKVVQASKDVDDLKARVEALEEKLQQQPVKRANAEPCPLCDDGAMKITATRPDPHFGVFGVQERTYTCQNPECGHTEQRQFDPRKDR